MKRTFTPEEQAKAQETRRLHKLARQVSTLRQDFLDAPYWLELGRKYNIRLPAWGIAPTVSNMRTWLHRVGIKQSEYEDYYGKGNFANFPTMNPEWPLRAWFGLVLEMAEDIGGLDDIQNRINCHFLS